MGEPHLAIILTKSMPIGQWCVNNGTVWQNVVFFLSVCVAKIVVFYAQNSKKELFFIFFKQKKSKIICFTKKRCTFASHLSIGLWCNGNTADSGPAFPGSNPGSPTKKRGSDFRTSFLCMFISARIPWCTFQTLPCLWHRALLSVRLSQEWT